MKSKSFFMIAGLAMMVFAAGCGKQPVEEITSAKSAVEALVAEGADKYAKEELKIANDDLSAAMAEVKAQDEKTFKNYDKAKELLAKAKTTADTVKADVPAKKEQAKIAAASAQEAAKTAVEEAKSLLAKAPKGKGTQADIEAMKADVAGLEQALAEVQALIDGGDYNAATEKANPIKDKAAELSAQIKEAMQKVAKVSKGGKKK
ncbi:MAG: hypothetical protein HW382_461 [Deltaproteobacteria bacterium]|nr:hypothetical protein [Deltaproteobacteria bacterium]MBM2838129.1 hypothetical protein [Deltaproteobacteria bacterium]